MQPFQAIAPVVGVAECTFGTADGEPHSNGGAPGAGLMQEIPRLAEQLQRLQYVLWVTR